MAKEMKIEGRAALIINECQLGVVDAAYAGFRGLADQVAERGILDRIATLADAFRARALPVFHAPVVHRDDLADIKPNSLINALTLKGGKLKKGSVEAEFVPQLKPHPQDFVLDRPAGLIAFNGTNLDATLRRMDPQQKRREVQFERGVDIRKPIVHPPQVRADEARAFLARARTYAPFRPARSRARAARAPPWPPLR